jgi:hypothetical protein
MIVPATIRIEWCLANGAVIVAGYIFMYSHFVIADAAQDGFHVKFMFPPQFMFMTCFFFMALKTRIILLAAFKFYGDYIK